jgi:mRNA interferase RelE/StbE
MRLIAAAEKPAGVYKLVLKQSARKELDDLSDALFKKIDAALMSLKNKPRPFPQAKKLEGGNGFRLRVGDYRIIYTVQEKEKVITIYRVRLRKDAYRRGLE